MDPVELRWLASNLLLPPAGPLLLAVIGLVLAACTRSGKAGAGERDGGAGVRGRGGEGGRAGGGGGGRWGWRLAAAGIAAAWLLATPMVAQTLARWVEGDATALSDESLRAELASAAAPGAVVVLGGGVAFDEREQPHAERVNAATLQRLAYGARLARVSGLPLLVSGGRPPRRSETEAALMARMLRESMGLAPRWLEDRSRDTAGNARESARMLSEAGVRRIVLVTEAYHMRRARAAFEAAGLEVLPAPFGFAGGDPFAGGLASVLPSAGATRLSWLVLHEVLGMAWYRLRGRA